MGNFATNKINITTSKLSMKRGYSEYSYNRSDQNSKRRTRGLTGRNFYDDMKRRDDRRYNHSRSNNRRKIKIRKNIRL